MMIVLSNYYTCAYLDSAARERSERHDSEHDCNEPERSPAHEYSHNSPGKTKHVLSGMFVMEHSPSADTVCM